VEKAREERHEENVSRPGAATYSRRRPRFEATAAVSTVCIRHDMIDLESGIGEHNYNYTATYMVGLMKRFAVRTWGTAKKGK